MVVTKDPYEGRLYPANDALENTAFTVSCLKYIKKAALNEAVIVYYGKNLAVGFGADFHILRLGDNDLLSVNKKNGRISITNLKIIDDRDNLVVEMDGDGYSLDKESHIRFKKPDASTLIVEDHLGARLLYIRYANPHLIEVQGVFRYPGFPVMTIDSESVRVGIFHMNEQCTIGNPGDRAVIGADANGGFRIS